MGYMPRELAALWQKRAGPIIRRWTQRGKRIDPARVDQTVNLIFRMELGVPECFSAENYHRSHHLPGCTRRRG